MGNIKRVLIDRNTLVGKDGLFSKRGCPGNCQHCNLWTEDGCRVILEAPTVDAVEVVHGRWIPVIDEPTPFFDCATLSSYKCSVCGRYEDEEEPYCNCGAKMDGDEE